MIGAVSPMLRATSQEATATAEAAAAAASVAMQALGGVAVSGEVVGAARRSCSRRRRPTVQTLSPGVGLPEDGHGRAQSLQHNSYNDHVQAAEHLSILSNPPTGPDKKTDDHRWQWKVELEEMKAKWNDLEEEKNRWQKDAEYLREQMNSLMGQYMDKIEKELQLTRQSLREETKEETRMLRMQLHKQTW